MRGARWVIWASAFALACVICGYVAIVAAALPVDRHYEMVTPLYKGGYGVETIGAVAMTGKGEGERVQFMSLGTFAEASNNNVLGNEYLARRLPSGWSTTPLMLPASATMPHGSEASREVVSPSLESVLFLGALASHASEVGEGGEEGPYQKEYLLKQLGATETPAEVVYEPLSLYGGGQLGDIAPRGASPNLCKILFYSARGPLLELDTSLHPDLYELSAGDSVQGCGGEAPWLRLVALQGPPGKEELINPQCFPSLGGGEVSGRDNMNLNVISADGSEVFFTADPNSKEGECDEQNGYVPEHPAQLFVRLNSERTVQISTPFEAPSTKPQPAVFTGANEAGTRVFFTTVQPLVTGDAEYTCKLATGGANGIDPGLGEFETQEGCEEGKHQLRGSPWKRFGNDLYMASLECPGGGEDCPVGDREVKSLVQASRSVVPGEAAEVEGEQVVAISPDGERVYFIARGVLTDGANREGRAPMKGADNLYVYEAKENKNRFIADLCSRPEQSGEVSDSSCPQQSVHEEFDSRLWLSEREAETTDDGRFLIFASYGQLTPDDTDTAQDIYLYDAATESLQRVSVGEHGADRNGNDSQYNVELPDEDPSVKPLYNYKMEARAISEGEEEGSPRIVFGTSDPLSSKATNGLSNVYEWHDGEVSLLSSGAAVEGVGDPRHTPAAITPSGRDIFFMTPERLVAQDLDDFRDIYDARRNAGPGEQELALSAEPQGGCEDHCHQALTSPAPVLVAGSVSQTPGENVAAPSKVKPKRKVKPKNRAKRKGRARRHGRRMARRPGARGKGRGR